MADSQVQAQHEEHQASEKPVAENGANGHDEHATNGAAAVSTNGESNGDSGNVKPVESAAESSPAKPKRTTSRVKDLFSRLFKRGKSKDAAAANEQNQNGDTPKKEKAKKEKCGKKQQETAANAAATDSTTTEKAAEDHDGAKLAEQTDNKLKIEDCVDTNGHVDEKAKAEEKADEKAGDKCADQVVGDAEKHDC